MRVVINLNGGHAGEANFPPPIVKNSELLPFNAFKKVGLSRR